MKRRNYPGDPREVGTKDYGLILSNLINYRNQLFRVKDEIETSKLFYKISIKLQELGFIKESIKVKSKTKNNRQLEKKRQDIINIATEAWTVGKAKHEKIRAELKAAEKKRKLEERRKRGWKVKAKSEAELVEETTNSDILERSN